MEPPNTSYSFHANIFEKFSYVIMLLFFDNFVKPLLKQNAFFIDFHIERFSKVSKNFK